LGTYVTIAGSRLLGGGTEIIDVSFDGVRVESIENSSDSSVVVRSGLSSTSATNGTVVLIANTGARLSRFGWNFVTPAIISSVQPSTGQAGTRCTISGQNLLGGGQSISEVYLDGVRATSVISSNDTVVIAVSAHSGATSSPGNVTLIADSGAHVAIASSWQFLSRGIVLTATPANGVLGTRVVIDGQRLLGGGASILQVLLAGVAVENITDTIFSDSSVSVVAGDGVNGLTGHITVISNTGSIVTGGNWTFGQRGLISSVNPAYGQFGTRVGISGSLLTSDGSSIVAVLLANVPAAIVNVSSSFVSVVASHSAASVGDVVLISERGGRTTSAPGSWEYRSEGSVAGVIPSSGMFGTTVIIFGSNLRGHGASVMQVTLNGREATISDETDSIVRVVAGENVPGSGDIVLTSVSGAMVRATNAWTYILAGNVTSVSPSQGQVGTIVSIFWLEVPVLLL